MSGNVESDRTSPATPGAPMPDPLRLRLGIAYDGTDFAGWAVQPGQRTVAGSIGNALAILFREPIPMVVAGRTDAGVHATGQVAHIEVPASGLLSLIPRDLRQDTYDVPRGAAQAGLVGLRRRLAGLLPSDVRVPIVEFAAEGFDARFSALRRHYRYRIFCSEWGLAPLDRSQILHWRRELDPDRMRTASAGLVGLHDFAAYCKPRDGATTIRHLQRLDVTSSPSEVGDGRNITVDVVADAFCHSMVRSLVGALIAVGDGRFTVKRPAELLAARARTSEVSVAPARGLTLRLVDYPAEGELAERAAATRAVRSDPCGCDDIEG